MSACVVLVGVDPVVTAGGALVVLNRGVTGLETDFGADPSADLNAGIGARDVEEPGPVDATNLHIFDRLGLYGKIGSLCPRDRNEARWGTEEKAFHHLHRDLQVCLSGGFRSPGAVAPWKVPLSSPRNH